MADTQYRITTNGKRFRIEQKVEPFTLAAVGYGRSFEDVWDALGETYDTLDKAQDMLTLLEERRGPWVPVEDAAVHAIGCMCESCAVAYAKEGRL